MNPTALQDVHFGHDALKAAFEHPSNSGRRKVEDDRVEAGVERAGEERSVPPALAFFSGKAYHMGHVVRPEADGKHQQGPQRQTNGPQTAPSADVRETGQD